MPVIKFSPRAQLAPRVIAMSTSVLLALSLSACRAQKKETEASAVERLDESTLKLSADAMKNIKIARADVGEFPEQLSIMGRISVTEDRIAVVPARIAGRIDAVYVPSGEAVAKGTPLASLFSADYVIAREEYLQARSQKQAGAIEGVDLVGMSRKKLINMGMSEQDIDLLSANEKNTTNLLIRAPRSGAVLDKKAVVGNVVNVGDTLFTIGDLSKVWFAGDIYSEDLAKVHKNQEIVIDPADGSPPVTGKVSFISPVVDPTTRTIKIRAMMDNPGSKLRADMYVKASLTLSKSTALLVPSPALVRLRDTTFCFKRVGGDVFKKIPIEVGKEQNGVAMVTKGIEPGSEVVAEGGLLLDAALTTSEK